MSQLYLIFLMIFSLNTVQAQEESAEEVAFVLETLNQQNTDKAQIECDLGEKYYDYKGLRGEVGAKDLDYDKAFEHFQKAANEGNKEAQFYLGRMYAFGHGVKIDRFKAVKLLHQSLKDGYDEARKILDLLYYELAKYDDQKFLSWLTQLANDGDAKAQYALAEWHKARIYFEIINKDIQKEHQEQSLHWLTQSAEQGYTRAQFDLGEVYDMGSLGVASSEAQAIKWYKEAAKNGHMEAQRNVGDMYYRGYPEEGKNRYIQDTDEAIRWYKMAGEQGDGFSSYQVAVEYRDKLALSSRTQKDIENAVLWFTRSAEQGNTQAQYILGRFYEHGHLGVQLDVKKNLDKAFDMYSRLAKTKDRRAKDKVIEMYNTGQVSSTSETREGIAQVHYFLAQNHEKKEDHDQAFNLYTQAANEGHPGAQFALGEILSKRVEDAEDEQIHKDALAWFRRAAEQGHYKAQNQLYIIYAHGRLGVEKDEDKASYWSLRKRSDKKELVKN